ncbi:hypothetical protein sscle_12g090760 [Sclerotinia sclerotiorum 1980 UF-70]|uniref:Letm1 RBD domain-containing protein n=1 Tax=Sclerotinia sclerotiorum (strain ATCC 18683 / 1980 / Ss-1) TaxID=665079 RepID=A0A1D9QH86_SCLS1|nr:hypothetical protein sscle_12g090760 [Sclerotinia sclerotiorum 1980 UF-70]
MRRMRTSTTIFQSTLKSQFQPTKSLSISLPHPSSKRFSSSQSNSHTSPTYASPTLPTNPINGPASTLPAPLDLPIREPNQPFFFKYAFTLGKAYAKFYKTGVKNIYYNFLASRTIQTAIDEKYKSSLSSAVKGALLSRSDFQLLMRNRHDVKRVPIFALVFLLCGEFTPLVVIAISNVVPWTCRIPKQIDADRRKLEERRAISFRNLTMKTPPAGTVAQNLQRMQLLHISWSLGLSSSMWDYIGGRLPGLPSAILRRKVAKRVKYLELDDMLIKSGGGVKQMYEEELRMACVERGIDVMGRDVHMLRMHLNAWLRSREKAGVETLLLTRPAAWPSMPKML